MDTINEHVFHGIYSNFGYGVGYQPSSKILFADTPIHCKRAIFGATDPYDENNTKPLEFKNEEDAFEWYKKNKYEKEEFEKINFPNDFCKNYFLISESDFHKYKNYFHGMIKSAQMKFNCSIEFNGFYEDINNCNCSSSSSSSSSSNVTSLSIVNIEDFMDILSEIYNKKIILQDSNDCCYCPPCELSDEEKSNYNCKSNFNLKNKINIDFDSSKIFEIDSFEKRFGALNIQRYFYPNYYDEKNGTFDALYNGGNLLYKDNWILNEDWVNIFKNSSKFAENSTSINDPVILYNKCTPDRCCDCKDDGGGGYTYFSALDKMTLEKEFNINLENTFSILEDTSNIYQNFNCLSTKPNWSILINPIDLTFGENYEQTVQAQKFKESTNFGNFSIEINGDNMVLDSYSFNYNLILDDIIYLKSEKKYMCFINIDVEYKNSPIFYIKRQENYENISTFESRYVDLNLPFLFSTNDNYKINENKNIKCINGENASLKLNKEKIPIKIGENNVEIEVFSPQDKTLFLKVDSNSTYSTSCENFNNENKKCYNFEYKQIYTFNKPEIKINLWDKKNFNSVNNFPPKLN